MNMKRTNGEKVFAVFNTIFLCALVIATLYPVLYVLFASLSNPIDFYKSGKFLLKPAGFSIESYKIVFKNSLIWSGYLNTIFLRSSWYFLQRTLHSFGCILSFKKKLTR